MGNKEYNDIIAKANSGDIIAMYELAQLYDSGVLEDLYDENYLYWLKKIIDSKEANEITDYYDDQSQKIDATVSLLQPIIADVFSSLGLYYINSGNIDDKELSLMYLGYAYDISKGSDPDLLSLITELNAEIEKEKGMI